MVISSDWYSKAPHSFNPLRRGCVLYLPLWHKSLRGPVFRSADPFRHVGTVTGALWQPQGRWFDGIDDIITIPDNSIYDLTTGFTMMFWASLNNVDADADYILTKSDGLSTGGGWLLSLYQTEQIYIQLSDGVVPSPSFLTTAAITPDTWTHIAVTWDGTVNAGSIHVYFDAIDQAGAENNYGTLPIINNLDVIIGNHLGGGATRNILGYLGDVSIHNVPLSQEEVTYVHQQTRGRYQ